MQVVCPILQVQNGDPAATAATPANPAASATDALLGPETDSSTTMQSGGFDEGFIQIKNTRIYGLRTYSIILIIICVYCYLCIKGSDIGGMKDLAIMAAGFLFGTKAIRRT